MPKESRKCLRTPKTLKKVSGTLQKHSPDTFRRLSGDFPDCPRDFFETFCQVRKVAERKFPEFFEFSSRILPRILLRIFPEFFEEFSCFVSWETETRKNSPKFLAIFQCKIPRQTRKKIFTKFFWRAGKVTFWGPGAGGTGRHFRDSFGISGQESKGDLCKGRAPKNNPERANFPLFYSAFSEKRRF